MTLISLEQYQKAIKNLLASARQLKPDGKPCSVCGDNGHQAWECHHNPLSSAYHYFGEGSYWKCYHCNLIFKDSKKAEEHFGKRESTTPVCKRLCSGYKIFPDGRKCEGCKDCQ